MAVYTGTPLADTITGSDDADSISGGAGTDSLQGGEGLDTISGGAGADTIDGGGSWYGGDDFASYASESRDPCELRIWDGGRGCWRCSSRY